MDSPLSSLVPGQIRKGIVKQILKSGASISFGNFNGFLNRSDMSWGHIYDLNEVVRVGQEIEVLIINAVSVQNIKLGLKQIQNIPLELATTNYPIGSRHMGKVVIKTPGYTYIQLESGVVGRALFKNKIHNFIIKEYYENLSLDERVEVEIVSICKAKHRIHFFITQPKIEWKTKAQKFKINDQVHGCVCAFYSRGALIKLEKGLFGFLHFDDLSWLKIENPDEMLKVGGLVKCLILNIDHEKCRIDIGIKQLYKNLWDEYIPFRYRLGDIIKSTISSKMDYGLFVELEPGLFGLLHNSELIVEDSEKFKNNLKKGDILEVCVIDVDITKRRIGLSLNISKNIIH